MEAALEAGADDVVTSEDGSIEVITSEETFVDVKEAMVAAGHEPELAEVTKRADNEITPTLIYLLRHSVLKAEQRANNSFNCRQP